MSKRFDIERPNLVGNTRGCNVFYLRPTGLTYKSDEMWNDNTWVMACF